MTAGCVTNADVEKNQFDLLMLAITGLKTEMAEMKTELTDKIESEVGGLRIELTAKMDAGFAEVRKDIAEVKADVTVIREHVAKLTETDANHESRIRRLEGPSA